jgi:hypothetical protein
MCVCAFTLEVAPTGFAPAVNNEEMMEGGQLHTIADGRAGYCQE